MSPASLNTSLIETINFWIISFTQSLKKICSHNYTHLIITVIVLDIT